jgi:cob(I)alamin adenosyltransferase
MAQKIYTKTGDKGTTSLIGGTKVPKSHVRIEAYGTVDELNSHIGLCKDIVEDDGAKAVLLEVQDRLFTIGSSLACDPVKAPKMRLPDLEEKDLELLENEMDRMNEIIPEMKNFILPGGHATLSQLHIARCVCRRAERCCVRLELTPDTDEAGLPVSLSPELQQSKTGQAGTEVEAIIIKYLNRLSDYLFVLSRYMGHQLHIAEIPWKARV